MRLAESMIKPSIKTKKLKTFLKKRSKQRDCAKRIKSKKSELRISIRKREREWAMSLMKVQYGIFSSI